MRHSFIVFIDSPLTNTPPHSTIKTEMSSRKLSHFSRNVGKSAKVKLRRDCFD